MEHFAQQIVNTIDANPFIAFLAVFLGGLLSSASPCVLAIIPLVIGFIGGYAEGDTRKAVYYSIVFVVGLTITFTLLGATVGFAGGLIRLLGPSWAKWGYIAIALIAAGAGLQLLGILNITLPAPIQKIQPKQKGIFGGLILGLLFGVASAPCATPVLAGILTFASVKGDVLYGAGLLFFYAIGHWALVLIAGISTGIVDKLAKARGINNFSNVMKKVSGVIFILGGFYIFWVNI